MLKITPQQIQSLTVPARTGRIPRAQSLFRELKEMEIGETRFLSKKEWTGFKYKGITFRQWWTMTKFQTRKAHRSSLMGITLEITTYLEGWTIKKI